MPVKCGPSLSRRFLHNHRVPQRPDMKQETEIVAGAQGRLVSSATFGMKVRRVLWTAVEGTLFRCSFHTMNRWRCFWLRRFGARIGKKCIIRRTVRVYYPWNLEV